MEQNKSEKKAARPRRSFLRGADGAVASAGLAVAAVLVVVLGASAWWTLHTYRTALQRSRSEQVATVGRLLSQSAESVLRSDGELTGLRRMVADAAANYRLSVCRVVLHDGSIAADADPQRISESLKKKLPEQFPSPAEAVPPTAAAAGPDEIAVRLPLVVAGRGSAVLELRADVHYPLLADWEIQAGIGGIAATGFVGLLVVFRHMRTRWRVLGAIRDALIVSGQGDDDPGALAVAERFGPEAAAWNRIVEERRTLRAERRLEKSSEKLARGGSVAGDLGPACDALWQGLIVLDNAGSIRYANGAAAVLLRIRREDLVGTPVAGAIGEPAAAEAITAVTSGKSRQRASVEITRTHENASAVLRITVKPARREDSFAALVVIEDVSQQRAADESRNAFVAQATHELRTPLTNMRLYVETFQENGDDDPQVRAKCINVISQEVRRLERIVSDMLSVSEIEAGALKLRAGEIRLDALFEELEADFRAQADDKEIQLAFELPPKLPVMTGDRDKLLLALHNLVGNALKYTPAGGRVIIRANAIDGGSLVVEVVDNGIGIKDDELELVFEKFYRAKDRRIAGIAGSGIGLALARQVVRLHGGDITVKSAIDKGSTFTLTVPIQPGGAPDEARRAA